MPPQISINQLVENPFEEPLTFLLTYSLLGDWYKDKGLNQQKEAIGYKFYWLSKEKKKPNDTPTFHRKQPKREQPRTGAMGFRKPQMSGGDYFFIDFS